MEAERIAAKIFQQYGLKFEAAKRAGGWTNGVWINGDLVLRLAFTQGSDRIRREIQLSQMLPTEVGYPVNIANGVFDGYEWSISRRIEGINLSDAWPQLTWVERALAVKQIWEIMQAVHSMDVEKVKALSLKNPWYSTLDADTILSRFAYYIDKGIFSVKQADVLKNILEDFFDKLSSASVVLNHGDITMDNILWSEGKIVSLMDFEHSVINSAGIDLNSIINLAFFDEEGYAYKDEENCAEFEKYKLDIESLLSSVLKQPGCTDSLLGFSILFQMRFLEFWLEDPTGEIDQFGPHIKLTSFADKHFGYLSQILNI